MIKFNAHADGRAIAMENHINLMKVWIILLIIGGFLIISGIANFIENNYNFSSTLLLIFLSLFGLLFIFLPFLVLLFINYDDKVFLSNTKKKHVFEINNNQVLKDNKKYSFDDKSKVYTYKKYLFLIVYKRNIKTYFIIYNDDYIEGNREIAISELSKLITVKKGF